jgi:hypothetical protein
VVPLRTQGDSGGSSRWHASPRITILHIHCSIRGRPLRVLSVPVVSARGTRREHDMTQARSRSLGSFACENPKKSISTSRRGETHYRLVRWSLSKAKAGGMYVLLGISMCARTEKMHVCTFSYEDYSPPKEHEKVPTVFC